MVKPHSQKLCYIAVAQLWFAAIHHSSPSGERKRNSFGPVTAY
jgi:hypothetical protein